MRDKEERPYDDGVAEFTDATCIHETPKALLCVVDGDEYWIPKGQIDAESDIHGEGDEGSLIISEWIALQKGLI